MKKILLLFLIILLSSCYKPVKEEEATRTVSEGVIPFNEAIHFEYKNHEYIKFYESLGNLTNSGVVHNPDCKYCKNE